jgi:hypothetical protein
MSWYTSVFGEGNVVRERSFTRWNDFQKKAQKVERAKQAAARKDDSTKRPEPETAKG